jgi:small redox-active disulfide protein 2
MKTLTRHPHPSKEVRTVKIQVLGTGCTKCKLLTANAERAVAELGMQATVEKVEDLREIMKFKVMSTPALVVDGVVKSTGKVLAPEAVKQLLADASAP